MKKKSVKFLVALVCALMALGIAGCGKKAYKTFPEKYKLASVDVGGMTADEAKKAIKTAVSKYKISVKILNLPILLPFTRTTQKRYVQQFI